MLLWHCCTWCSNETLWEMLIWGQWDHVLYFWVSWCFCDAVAPDCGKCWFEGNETMFLIPELLWCCCTWCSNDTLWEMLIWWQWDHVLYFWVSWCFCDTVAPDVQMRLCGKCWFEGNETMFFISESPDAFVTLLPLMFKWDFVGNVDLRAMRPLFLISESPDAFVTLLPLMFKWDFVGNVDLRAMRPCSLLLSLLMLLWHCCTWCSNETLWEMLIWGQWVFVLNFWVSWCFCDTVAPDVQMRHCGKCWFEGNESLFLISESPDAFVTLLHLMFKWDFVGNVDLRAMRPCSLFLSLLMLFDAVAPDVQMRHCGKCWFDGSETMFFISESRDAFVTLLPLMFKWDIVGNVDLRAMRPCSLFLSLLMLLWCCCTWCSNETLWEMLIWGQWVFVLKSWVSCRQKLALLHNQIKCMMA